MTVFLALDVYTFSRMALGQNLILYVLVLSVERVMKFMREVFQSYNGSVSRKK